MHSPVYVVWVQGILKWAAAAPAPFEAEGEGVVAASLRQLPQTPLVRVEQRGVGGGVQLLDRLRPRQKRGGLLPSWQMQRLYADLRGWQRGARARRQLFQDGVGAQVAAGS